MEAQRSGDTGACVLLSQGRDFSPSILRVTKKVKEEAKKGECEANAKTHLPSLKMRKPREAGNAF